MKSFSSFPMILAFLLLSLSTLPQRVTVAESSDAKNNAQLEARISDDLNYLASDEREGRGPYTLGQQAAADYIAKQFAEAGLKTKLISEGPFQVFSTRKFYDLGERNQLAFSVHGEQVDDIDVTDYRPLSPSTSGKFDLPLALAGYGITSKKDDYDDYANFDAQGKAVIVLRHEPDQAGKTGKFAGPGNSTFAYLSTKIQNAVDHGAAAVLVVTDEVAVNKKQGQDDLLEFQIRMPKDFKPQVPVFHVKRAVIDALLKQAGKESLAEWEAVVDQTWKPNSFDLDGVHAEGEVEITTSERVQKNVLGVLPGKGDLASEVVVVGAHYDHLGRGGSGSLAPWTRDIHNGADDNASGTVALLETARQCAAWDMPNRRTILFIAFCAEEQGLLGSEYYVRHPLYDIKQTVAMLNYDMVGRLRKESLTVYGHDTAKEFEAWLDEAAPEYGLTINKIEGGYGPSDHASFYGRGVPVMHDFTGFHSQYHRPSDDIEYINVPGIRQIVGMNMAILKHMATEPITPVAESKGSLLDLYFGGGSDGADAPQSHRTLGVALGDYDETGMPIKAVGKGSIAQKAGIRQGDVLIAWGDKLIESLQDLRQAINAAEPGQKILVRILRGEMELEVEVEFAK
ncbi:M20/M25/M40 family metallo-hydrolase [Blastopirellula marina]|uniref:Aminopeptidase n=1 Tax=Blastopirellula marina TaxID=124 RepID=A0A2S8G1G3_9BACT|nr:M20/M25/M40 family metallo-hydrolase [Blastopirellula marina]PQO38285.1 aminopeptidase [Blastopirellula marina]PTL44941.1 PDZ domain-containing protein [Blastopirellula marina]